MMLVQLAGWLDWLDLPLLAHALWRDGITYADAEWRYIRWRLFGVFERSLTGCTFAAIARPFCAARGLTLAGEVVDRIFLC